MRIPRYIHEHACWDGVGVFHNRYGPDIKRPEQRYWWYGSGNRADVIVTDQREMAISHSIRSARHRWDTQRLSFRERFGFEVRSTREIRPDEWARPDGKPLTLAQLNWDGQQHMLIDLDGPRAYPLVGGKDLAAPDWTRKVSCIAYIPKENALPVLPPDAAFTFHIPDRQLDAVQRKERDQLRRELVAKQAALRLQVTENHSRPYWGVPRWSPEQVRSFVPNAERASWAIKYDLYAELERQVERVPYLLRR